VEREGRWEDKNVDNCDSDIVNGCEKRIRERKRDREKPRKSREKLVTRPALPAS